MHTSNSDLSPAICIVLPSVFVAVKEIENVGRWRNILCSCQLHNRKKEIEDVSKTISASWRV